MRPVAPQAYYANKLFLAAATRETCRVVYGNGHGTIPETRENAHVIIIEIWRR